MDEYLNLQKVPFKIDVDDKTFLDDENMEMDKFIRAMKASPNPIKSSCPSLGDFKAQFTDVDSIFVVTISKELSGTYNSAILARDMAMEETKDRFIHVFNSTSASVGETLVAMKIKESIDEELSNEEGKIEPVEKIRGSKKAL